MITSLADLELPVRPEVQALFYALNLVGQFAVQLASQVKKQKACRRSNEQG
jgi:hypothetical protein